MNNYTPWTTEQKKQYAKRFSKRDREMYNKGKRNQYLKDVHSKKFTATKNFDQRTYTQSDYDRLFKTLGEVQ